MTLGNDDGARLIALEKVEDYASAMNTLGAEVLIDQQISSLISSIRFRDELLSCSDNVGPYQYYDDGDCSFVAASYSHLDRKPTEDNLGFEEDAWNLSAGFHREIAEGWNAGGGLRYERRNLTIDAANSSSNGEQVYGGVSLKRQFDAIELAAGLAAGYGSFDFERNLIGGFQTTGTQGQFTIAGQARASYMFDFGNWFFTPMVNAGFDYFKRTDFTESGSSALRLVVDGSPETYFNFQPGLEVGGQFTMESGVILRPTARVGVTMFLGDANPMASTRFISAPAEVPSFETTTDIDDVRLDLIAGLDIFATPKATIRLTGVGSFSENSSAYGARFKIEIPF